MSCVVGEKEGQPGRTPRVWASALRATELHFLSSCLDLACVPVPFLWHFYASAFIENRSSQVTPEMMGLRQDEKGAQEAQEGQTDGSQWPSGRQDHRLPM